MWYIYRGPIGASLLYHNFLWKSSHMRPHWCRLAVEVFYLLYHIFLILSNGRASTCARIPFFKYNIIFFYISQVAALHFFSLLIQDRLFGAEVWCERSEYQKCGVEGHMMSWRRRATLSASVSEANTGICDPALGNGPTAGSGVRAFLASLDNSDELAGSAISGGLANLSGELASHFGIRMHA